MSSLENQQWFVLRSNGQDGPFDQYEFSERIESGDIESSALVWREGFASWIPCNERHSMAAAVPAPLIENAFASESIEKIRRDVLPFEPKESRQESSTSLFASLVSMKEAEDRQSQIAWLDVSGGITNASSPVDAGPKARFARRNVTSVVAIAILITAVGGLLSRNTLPDFADGLVAPQEKKMLLLARSAEASGIPRAAIAKALQGSFFYIASNARAKDGGKDGAVLTVRIDGVPRSLVGRIHYSVETAVTLQDGIAITPELGQASKGKYRVSVLSPETGGVLTSATYFLGGSADAAYYKDLEDFLLNVDAQAETERMETQQFIATLQKLMSDTTERYAKFSPKMEKRKWDEFHNSWARLFSQIKSASKTWKSDSNVLRARYLGLSTLSDLVAKLHERQSLIIQTGVETDRDRNELAGILTSAESELRKLTGPES